MYGTEVASSVVRRTANFDLPRKRKRDKTFKIEPGRLVFTCFTSDFFIDEADEWRKQCWQMIRQRSDLMFYMFTKRIHRFEVSLPSDWGDGYNNVIIGCTVENQNRADYRLPIFRQLPIKHRTIICAPILENLNLRPYLDSTIEDVAVSGESGLDARICDYSWVLNIRQQCVDAHVPFTFHQTGAKFLKDGKLYNIKRKYQIAQANRANINIDSPGSKSLFGD